MIATAVAGLAGCRLVAGDPDAVVSSIAMDSRAVAPGGLFVAIRGGHDHVGEAVAAGAVAVLVRAGSDVPAGVAVLVADDPIAALGAIGAANAAAARAIVVGITGSSGKTSTKDVLATLLRGQRRVVAAAEGHNNEIGLPFTLARIAEDTEVAVCELAMRGAGQIAALAALARPQVGVITNVGEAHVELLGSRAAIAAAKAELLQALPAGGIAVVPDAEPLLEAYRRDDLVERSFGETAAADVRIVGRRTLAAGSALELDVGGRRVGLQTNLVGAHHARNLAAAFAVCAALGLDLDACAEDAAQIALQRWRSEELPLPGGGLIVNDAYNANPSSAESALAALAERRRPGRLVAVLGAMAELGDQADALHRRVGATAAELGYDVVVAVGAAARPYLDGLPARVERHARVDRVGLEAFVAGLLEPGDRVLVKGSRAAGLEHVATGVAEAAAKGVR